MNKLFTYIILLLLLTPGVIADGPETIEERFEVFVEGFDGIENIFSRNGSFDSGPMVEGFIAILPVVGLTVIVFGLMFFVTKISIFKSPDHDRYARMIAFGVALIGLAMPAVYNVILGLSTVFLIFVFMLAIGFIFVMFYNYNRKEHLKSHAELHQISGDAYKARRDLENIKHDLKNETKLRNKTDRDLEELEHDLSSIQHLAGTELHQVDHIAKMLRKATAAHKSGDSNAVDQYAAALGKDIGGLITTMQHEHHKDVHLHQVISKIDREIDRWDHNSDKAKSEEDHLNNLFKKLASEWGAVESTSGDFSTIAKDNAHLRKELRHIRSHLHQLEKLKDTVMKEIEHLDSLGYQQKHLEANAVRDAIMSKQFEEAHKHLDNLRAKIEQEPKIIKGIKHLTDDMHGLLSKIDSEEKRISALFKGSTIKKIRGLSEQK